MQIAVTPNVLLMALKILNTKMNLHFSVVEHLWQVVVAYEKSFCLDKNAMQIIHF